MPEAEFEGATLAEPVGDALAPADRDSDGEVDALAVARALADAASDALGLADAEPDAEGDRELAADAEALAEADAHALAKAEREAAGGVAEPLAVWHAEPLAPAPETEAGALGVTGADGDALALAEGVSVAEPLAKPDAVPLAEF